MERPLDPQEERRRPSQKLGYCLEGSATASPPAKGAVHGSPPEGERAGGQIEGEMVLEWRCVGWKRAASHSARQ
jgi:hypothetical protein